VRILTGAAGTVGRIVDIIGQTSTTLTLADPVNIAVNDTFDIELYSSLTGAPLPQGPIYGGLCPNTIGTTTGLPAEPGVDTSALPGTTQGTAFVAAFTLSGTSPLTNPVWSPFDFRFEEETDTDADGIPDQFDNCTTVANGPNAGPPGCFYSERWDAVTKQYVPYATASPTPSQSPAVKFKQVDTDGDGYGEPCDGDFNFDTAVNSSDVALFGPDLGNGTSTPGTGTDMNCDTAVNSSDVVLFGPQLGLGSPGPSGLWCAGTGTVANPCTM
jgi:hypothetical protein